MQLIKQLVTRQLQKYQTHFFNNRFFPNDFYHSWAFTIVVLNIEKGTPIPEERIRAINALNLQLNKTMIEKTIRETIKQPGEDQESFNKRRQENLRVNKEKGNILFHKIVSDDMKQITQFLNEYKDVHIIDNNPKLHTNTPGCVLVEVPFLSYNPEKQFY